MGTDVEGTVFAIVACTRALKAFSESGTGATSNGDVEEMSGGRDDRAIVANLYDKRLIVGYCVFIQAVFWVDGSKRGRSIGWGRRGQSCKQR